MGQDVRFAFRVLVRDRGFALTAILVLGLGIGVNNMLCTIIYAHTLRGLPVTRADRVLYISTFDDKAPERALSYPDLVDLQGSRSFAQVAAFFNAPATVGDEGRAPDRFEGAYVTAGAFELLAIAPVVGRTFLPNEDRIGAIPVVMLGSGAWQSRYGGNAGILGQSVLINGTPATVIGIIPHASGFPSTAEVWLPLSQMPGFATDKREARTLRVLGRLRDDGTVAEARAEVEALVDRIARDHPQSSQGLRGEVTPINQRFLGRPTDPAWLAFITAGFLVLVVSCANVANLLLARSVLRAREIAIRGSLGASRWRIVGQLLLESILLAMLGGALGLGISLGGVQLFRTAVPDNVLPYWFNYTMNAQVFAALVAVSFGAVLLFGLVPAIQASRTDMNRVLKDGGRTGAATRHTSRWTTAFLAAELGLTVILMSHVITALRSTAADLPSDALIRTSAIITASIALPVDQYRTPEQRADFFRRLGERLGGVSAVDAHAIASVPPVRAATEFRLELEGRSRGAHERGPSVWSVGIGPGYFETLAVPLHRGRDFTEQDNEPSQQNVIVNQRFVELFFPQQDPIGQRIQLSPPNGPRNPQSWLSIIGVSQTIRQRPSSTPDPVAYRPFNAAAPVTAALLVRSRLESAGMTSLLREHLLAIDPHVPVYRVMTLSRAIEESDWNRRVSMRLIVTLALITLAFSVVGLYAVTAHAVGQRTQEIGIRMALGAQSAQVRQLILRRAAMQVALGLVAGIIGTLAWGGLFYSGRSDLRFASPGTLIPLLALLALVTLVACVVPVRRATRLDPVTALRQE